MTVEHTFNGAKSGLTFMYAYLNSVAGEIGMEQALALDTKTCQDLGAAQGQMIKEQAGTEEVDLRTAEKMLTAMIEEGLGITSEVAEEKPNIITRKIGKKAAMDMTLVLEICYPDASRVATVKTVGLWSSAVNEMLFASFGLVWVRDMGMP